MTYFGGGGGGVTPTGNTNFTGNISVLDGSKFKVKNQADPTKILQFSAASVSAGATRTITFTDVDQTVVNTNGGQTISGTTSFVALSMNGSGHMGISQGSLIYLGTDVFGQYPVLGGRTQFTPTSGALATGTLSNSFHICEYGDAGFDFNNGPGGASACTDPTLIIHSHNQSTTQWIALAHNGTDGVISTGAGALSIASASGVKLVRTVTAGGTTGNQTINKMAGTVNFAAGASSITVSNSLVDTSSIIFGVIRTADATATFIKSIVPSASSFVITLNAVATAETSVGFMVTN